VRNKTDPSDNKFIECAIEGRCDFVVTGDRHLLDLQEYAGILILPVAGFLERVDR
jgi:predicted nucleic acid-binding protein